MRAYLLIIFVIIFLPSCLVQPDQDGSGSRYFSMDSLIDNQVAQLMLLKPELRKEAILDDNNEDIQLQLDSLGWENELKIFREANIDKPAYYGSYIVKRAEKDTNSNLLFDEYLASEPDKVHVQSMRVYYLDHNKAMKKVLIIIEDKNELFESERNLLMIFDDRGGNAVLSTYQVQGKQRFKLNDSVTYQVNGTLIF